MNGGSEHSANSPVAARAMQARASRAYVGQLREANEEQWILQNLPMVRCIAGKIAAYLPQGADMEDLISAGTLGLVRAARAYDPEKDAEFRTYAYIRIRGAIIDELRRRSFVPSAIFHDLRRIEKAYRKLIAERGELPTDDEISKEANMSQEQMYRTLQKARTQHFLSIHGLSEDEPAMKSLMPVDSAPSPERQAEHNELMARMAQAIRDLPERDRLLLLLYYERDLSMKEIAEVLDITESRVSQLHASALFKLSMKLG